MFLKIKYSLLKLIDLSGLTFFDPIVRLCFNDEPNVQLKKIGQWIVVPLIAIFAAGILYNIFSQKVDTKSGKLPTTSIIWSSYKDIDDLHVQERYKEHAYELEGEEREKTIIEVEAEIKEVEAEVGELDKLVATELSGKEAEMKKILAPVELEQKSLKEESDTTLKEREEVAKKMAEDLQVGDKAAYEGLIAYMRKSRALKSEYSDKRNLQKKEVEKVRETEFPAYAEVKRKSTKAIERKAFLESYLKILTKDNKALSIAAKQGKVEDLWSEMLTVKGAIAYKNARSIVLEEASIEKKETSSYAGAKTIWFQVQRSILCVFTGFFIGSAIAIPLGILCGLNKTFMAAMTPFIAIFKPVSPIVWLPIVLIVVTGFFPDADKNPVMLFLWDLPFIGQYKINPAFIASAVTVALCSLWATMANTALGVASIDKDHMNVARVLKLGFFARLFKIVIPSSLPLIFAGLRISLGVGWMVLVAAELLSSSEGIGKFVNDEFNNGSSDSLAKMIVVVFIVGFIGLLLDRIMVVFQRLVSFEGSAATV